MAAFDLLAQRISNQGLGAARFADARSVVEAFGGVQAQDFAGATWAVAQRTSAAEKAAVVDAFDRGEIVRTHLLRPTWHFVAASDLGWLLELTGSRVEQSVSSYYRKSDLDAQVFRRTDALLEESLAGGSGLSRAELSIALTRGGIDVADPVRFTHIMMHAEATGLICSGPLRAGAQTWSLVAERTAGIEMLRPSDPALELARRYIRSHGPATIADFGWWSGMTLARCRSVIAEMSDELEETNFANDSYWAYPVPAGPARDVEPVTLLANYDEYLVGYCARDEIFDIREVSQLGRRPNPVFHNVIISEGRVIGTWTRGRSRGSMTAVPHLFKPVARSVALSLRAAVDRFTEWATRESQSVLP